MSIKQADFDKGRLALERFRKMIATRYLPLLRSVTGNEKLQVVPHPSRAFTDNKTVWLPVPLALGDETLEHDKSKCGVRDAASMEMLCPMCNIEDLVDAYVFHESAHITENTFEEVNGKQFLKDIYPVIEPYLNALEPQKRTKVEDEIKSQTSPMAAANKVDPWLPMGLNVVEDIYVNRRLMKYREGTELPLILHAREAFIKGVTNASTGETYRWSENDENSQALMSPYLIGAELRELGAYLDPAHDLTGDPILEQIMEEIPNECSIKDRIAIAVKLIMHLRTLGYCPAKQDTIRPPPPPTEPQENPEPQPPSGESEPEPQPGEGEGEGEGGSEGRSDGRASAPGCAAVHRGLLGRTWVLLLRCESASTFT